MKSIFVVALGLAGVAAQAAPPLPVAIPLPQPVATARVQLPPPAAPQAPQAPQPVRDLREVLEQYHPGADVPAPRQLTPGERAELRRQLSQYGPQGRR